MSYILRFTQDLFLWLCVPLSLKVSRQDKYCSSCLNLIMHANKTSNNCPSVTGQLVALDECTCPGHELRFQCTVMGGGFTIWRGTALNGCSNNRIQLRHTQFEDGLAVGQCNNGAITGHGLRRVGLNFTSELAIHLDTLSNDYEGRVVECVYVNTSHITTIGTYVITLKRGIIIICTMATLIICFYKNYRALSTS